MTIGQRIREKRKEMKISAEELGALLGKNRATIYRYEKGEIENLPLDILEPIAKALDTTPAYLMGWTEEIEKNPIEMAQRHFEMTTDVETFELFEIYKKLNDKNKKLVSDLIHTLANSEA